MEVNGQLHALVALLLMKEPVWVPELVWQWWEKKTSCLCQELNSGHPAHSSVTALIEISFSFDFEIFFYLYFCFSSPCFREFGLKPLLYEYTKNLKSIHRVAAVVHINSPIKHINDLKGKRVCFSVYNGVGEYEVSTSQSVINVQYA
jgi:hypothetical protein